MTKTERALRTKNRELLYALTIELESGWQRD
jgi:hypothetical protein